MNSLVLPSHETRLSELARDCDGSPASYLRTARAVTEADAAAERTLRVSWLGSFTTDLLSPYVLVEGARHNLRIDNHFAPFGQLEQLVFDASSDLYRSNPDVIIVALRVEDSVPTLVDGWLGVPASETHRLVCEHAERISAAVVEIRKQSSARLLVWNQAPASRLAAGLADAQLRSGQSDLTHRVNVAIAGLVGEVSDAYVFDIHRLVTELGSAASYDSKLAHLFRMPWSIKAQIEVSRSSARCLRAMWKAPCKCLVLDLDNTLWGGVIGEDGLGGIKLGEDYPGSAFVAFQSQVLSYRDRGTLLAVASKNNEADAAEVFEKHPNMMIKMEHLSARRINWSDKAESLRAIAHELSIGLDSLAFFDDNPVERDFVRRQLPEVTVIDVPRSPLEYGRALDDSGAFDALAITVEDLERSKLYRTDGDRKKLEHSATSVESFLRNLEMRVTIGELSRTSLPRAVQLLSKTNQFNVTTRRHTQADLERFMSTGAIALWMRVEDRFGDSGVVGLALALPDETATSFSIDTFLMSCRVLGRRVENALLHSLAGRAHGRGAQTLFGQFVPTKKNAPAAEFFTDSGFRPIEGRSGHFRIDLPLVRRPDASLFEVTEIS